MTLIRNIFNNFSTNSKGQGLAEFSLVILIFLIMSYIIFEVGRAVFIYQAVLTASQEAARLGASVENEVDCDEIIARANEFGDFDDVIISYDQGLEFDEDVEEWVPNDWETPDPDCEDVDREADLVSGDRIVVTVIGHFDPVVPIYAFSLPEIQVSIYRTIINGIQLDE